MTNSILAESLVALQYLSITSQLIDHQSDLHYSLNFQLNFVYQKKILFINASILFCNER